MDFTGKTALVTGAAGSIGRGIAARFIEQGASVWVTDLSQPALDEVCSQLGSRCYGLAADVTVAEDVRQVVQAAADRFEGRIDMLINVAGTVGIGGPVEDMDLENWEQVFAVNCRGTFLFVKHVVPWMKRQGAAAS
jgi:NAD(P)-dependent dehydrogenase (short-subunit alcohol dehydrogenase family)